MTLLTPLFTLPIALIISLNILGQAEREIYVGLKEGDSKKIAPYFTDNVSITLRKETGYYSKFQSEMILKDFLRNYRAIEVKQVPVKNDKQNYRIYEFVTASNTFRVFVQFDMVKEKVQISELRIE
ncbi:MULTISPECIES: DUF4783 domain-containing protein [Sphingobacterium]|uniref:DUF4783 domain-containing protein n=1 Tax=Sphingobacterium populi TaxID=1812824 RepID=A0ABW5UA11_9SPHI|nr:DUF4783 domain-containing protein [Sphingobacterium sp. CFCC 11742]